jgi:hypothetical protein
VPEDKGVFSGTLATGGVPGAFGTENLANETGLNVVGRLVDPARLLTLLSARLASDSEPPKEAESSPPSDADVAPFISSTFAATELGPCFDASATVCSPPFSLLLLSVGISPCVF